eukprot:CAMPEP_0197524418 /NCGR_PEP_ID=MMETSP1318-20131121/9105_1 /TAXON_ID=552666 /ORGANISM="Partenskyella glossopodia, Strain RCC365" /LENGTH=169 /DNA_ID=CAMNT_0043077371 /DNA_START=33 /DNA_END=542 /DNA_ORIENTATION=+
MKFMKRKEEAEIRQKLERERKKKRKAAQWNTEDRTDSSSVVIAEEDEMHKTRFMMGRRSFGGFNPNVTNNNAIAMGTYRGNKQLKNAVSEEEMAKRYKKFVGMRGSKAEAHDNRRNRKRSNKSSDRRSPKGKDRGSNKGRSSSHGSGNKSSGGGTPKRPRPFKKPKVTL